MPRSSSVSEKVWAQAIHAVNVQKMSLRRAAQLYGVHHMSLHRRVRGRHATNNNHADDGFQLSPVEEAEVVGVLREQFVHEHSVTSDDVRYVVRTIAGNNGRRSIPADFPSNRWIAHFKRIHGFSQPARSEAGSEQASPRSQQSPRQQHRQQQPQQLYDQSRDYECDEPMAEQAMRQAETESDRRQRDSRELYASLTTPRYSTSVPSTTTSTSASSFDRNQFGDTSDSESENRYSMSTSTSTSRTDRDASPRGNDAGGAEEKKCRQSNLVSAETWEKAMDAVEIHGMSLRNAAKAHGVHFAALHRRLKKRAIKKEATPPLENYIPFEDEAGIVRVIHARADLGILITFDELTELLHKTALKYTNSISVETSQAMVARFQSRVEQSIRHLVKDWPLPRLDALCRYRQGSQGALVAEEKTSSMSPTSFPPIYSRNQEAMMVDSPTTRSFVPPPLRVPISAPLSFETRSIFVMEESKSVAPVRQLLQSEAEATSPRTQMTIRL
ncbi:TPA: hypothetical protein N0F65_012214 [Lagenidium giganteum]|uniref:HTH psq-type domain-containing protein n=1 Tax=Lagenidium giganteum TaxID=4803 RepID=A0AAV2ZB20_9STRA|nr:TPA: hypothetical protein N0F65_012214 [Lagenidium giganteum]